MTTLTFNPEVKFTEEQLQKATKIGADTITGDLLDDNFTVDEDECKSFYLYGRGKFIAIADRNMDVIEK